MARVTVSDCMKLVSNRFELLCMAAKRAHEQAGGASALVPLNNDKPTVLTLREIAGGLQQNLDEAEQEAIPQEMTDQESLS